MNTLSCIIERANGELWGRLTYGDDLIVEKAKSVTALDKKFRKLLWELYEIEEDDVQFDISYDLTVFFEEFNFLKQSSIAAEAGINPSALRQFASGVRNPSEEQVKKIEAAVRLLGKRMEKISLAV